MKTVDRSQVVGSVPGHVVMLSCCCMAALGSVFLFVFCTAERDRDVVFLLKMRVGAAGLARFGEVFAGELEGLDRALAFSPLLVGVAELDRRLSAPWSKSPDPRRLSRGLRSRCPALPEAGREPPVRELRR